LQKGLEISPVDPGIQQMLDETNVTISLSKLFKLSHESQQYLQRATMTDTTLDPAVIEVNATTLDPDAAVIHL
jgi:hypothetical protein